MNNPIKVGGVETFSTVDFPDKIAAVVFMQGCPWQCPFCHNAFLQKTLTEDNFIWDNFIKFLQNRRGILDGVVFSGGEPLMQNGLASAIKEVKNMGFLIGLHTGGYRPKHFVDILSLVDWVGFDIKAPFVEEKYKKAIGGISHLKEVQESLALLVKSKVDFECRTTCDPRLLTIDDIYNIADELKTYGVKKYFLQKYRPVANDKISTDEDCDKFFLDKNLIAYLQQTFQIFDVRR